MANTQPPDQFKTWSEIAGYLGISVREAQYRETNEGLPIRRMGGKKPRVWKEQFRRRGDVPSGSYDIHKTHGEGHASFAEDPVDRTGLWTIDSEGNITAR